jgi:hypothetical protein
MNNDMEWSWVYGEWILTKRIEYRNSRVEGSPVYFKKFVYILSPNPHKGEYLYRRWSSETMDWERGRLPATNIEDARLTVMAIARMS